MNATRLAEIQEKAQDDWDCPWLGGEVDELIGYVRMLTHQIVMLEYALEVCRETESDF